MEGMEYRKEFASYGKRITLLWGAFIVCLVFTATISMWLGSIVGDRVAFILVSSAVIGVVVLSMPALNYIVYLNEAIDLPDSPIEEWLRSTEAAARAVTDELMKADSAGMLVMTVFVAGVLTGLGEELFFRGAQQRIFMLRGINGHVAVWVTAIIFSLLHFQFYGFIPRMLLGAFFGYLAWKGGSLWLPIIAHALNNSLAVVFGSMSHQGVASMQWLNTCGVPSDGDFPFMALLSAVATAAFIVCGKKLLVGGAVVK